MSLSNMSDSGALFFTRVSQLEARWDPNFYQSIGAFRKRLKNCAYPIQKLKQSLALVQYGISERATEESVGVPMLRMINLQNDSWDVSDLKFIAMSDEERA